MAGQPAPLNFGVSGKLIMNVLVMYDRETDTLWSQILGEGVQGELAGTKLEPLPALQTTWGQWKSMHPDTLALDKGFSGSFDAYTGYYSDSRAGVLGETLQDTRLGRKERGLAMMINDTPVFYPLRKLSDRPVVNDQVAGVSLVVVYRAETGTASAFSSSVDGKTLTFELDQTDGENFILVDRETGSRWNAWAGSAFEGSLAGMSLERLPSTNSFWFGWKDWHPDTLIYAVAENGSES